MSAFVVSAAHIATCAAILRKTVFEHENAPPSDTDIRMDLAMSNVISVTWRYGPAGEHDYAPILASIAGKLDESGYNTNGAEFPEAASGVNEACFDDGFTVTDYFEDCRRAKAIPPTPWPKPSCTSVASPTSRANRPAGKAARCRSGCSKPNAHSVSTWRATRWASAVHGKCASLTRPPPDRSSLPFAYPAAFAAGVFFPPPT